MRKRFIDQTRVRPRAVDTHTADINKAAHTGTGSRVNKTSRTEVIHGFHPRFVALFTGDVNDRIDTVGQRNLMRQIHVDALWHADIVAAWPNFPARGHNHAPHSLASHKAAKNLCPKKTCSPGDQN
jgi:hypothetical protein